jgi:anti-sigma factor RsiW
MVTDKDMQGDGSFDLHAYLDGELGPDDAAEVEAALASDPRAMARFDAYARQKDLIREAAGSGSLGGISNFRTAALEQKLAGRLAARLAQPGAAPGASGASGASDAAWRWPMQAAAALALLAGGWFGHAQLAPDGPGAGSDVAGVGGFAPEYVAEAVGAHGVFAQDFLHPAEFGPGGTDEAMEWISAKLGHAIDIPSLEPLGLEFVGSRLLGTKEGPIAYFLYEKPDGTRVSLTLSRHPDGEPALEFATYGSEGRHVGYWSAGDLDYALIGEDGDEIRQIAAEVDHSISF